MHAVTKRHWGRYVAVAWLAAGIGCSGDDTAPDTTSATSTGGQGGKAGATTGAGGSGGSKAGADAGKDAAAGKAGNGGAGGSAGNGGGGLAGEGGGGAGGQVGVGGAAGDVGGGGVGGSGGSADAGYGPECAIAIIANTYMVGNVGCNGIATCRGVIQYMNNSGVTINYPTIRFTVPDGVACTKSHSTSKWMITDDGSFTHRCAFTTNPTTPWNVVPGNSFRFGYDVTIGIDFPPPTDITVSDYACVGPDGGTDAGEGGTDAPSEAASPEATTPDGSPDATPDAAPDAPADAAPDTPTDAAPETSTDTGAEAHADAADSGG